jgi:hypothetical protein
MKRMFWMSVALAIVAACFCVAAQAGEQCPTCPTYINVNINHISVGAISQNEGQAQTIGSGNASAYSWQGSTVVGKLVFDPVASITTLTQGGSVVGSYGNAAGEAANAGTATGSAGMLQFQLLKLGR